MKIQDPDELIHEIAWKGIEEIKQITLSFPEDYEILNEYINKKSECLNTCFFNVSTIRKAER